MTDEELDNELLKNVGDIRKIRQEKTINGKIVEIERKRNDKGGVDVKINVLTPFSISGKGK